MRQFAKWLPALAGDNETTVTSADVSHAQGTEAGSMTEGGIVQEEKLPLFPEEPESGWRILLLNGELRPLVPVMTLGA